MEDKYANLLDDLIDAAVDDHEKARQLLQEHPSLLCARRGLGETALHFLAVEGYVEGVRFLASAGADVNATNQFGHTPLIEAALLGEEQIVRILLSFGADANAKSATMVNALHCGIASGVAGVVEALLQAGANPNYRSELDETPFSALPDSEAQRRAMLAVFARYSIATTK